MKHLVEILSATNLPSSLAIGDSGEVVRAVDGNPGEPKRLKISWESGVEEDLVIGQHEFKISWVTSDTESLDSDLVQRISFASDHPSFSFDYPNSQSDAVKRLSDNITRENFRNWTTDYGSIKWATEIDSDTVNPDHIWTVLDSGYAINGYLTAENRELAEEQNEALDTNDVIVGFFIREKESRYELFDDWIQTQISSDCGDCLDAWTRDQICKVCDGEEFVTVKLHEENPQDS